MIFHSDVPYNSYIYIYFRVLLSKISRYWTIHLLYQMNILFHHKFLKNEILSSYIINPFQLSVAFHVKPVIWFAVHIKWLVTIWNATQGWIVFFVKWLCIFSESQSLMSHSFHLVLRSPFLAPINNELFIIPGTNPKYRNFLQAYLSLLESKVVVKALYS